MKISKKKIIVIVVVLAVVAFLVWKKRKSANEANADTSTGSNLSKYDVNDVIAAAGITGQRAQNVLSKVGYLNGTTTWKAKIEDKAAQEGRTYEQQVVITALYAFYYKKKSNGWQIGKSQFNKYVEAIDAM